MQAISFEATDFNDSSFLTPAHAVSKATFNKVKYIYEI